MSGRNVADANPAQSLALLWSSHTKPGRSGLTVRGIVTAAIELADAEGLGAVSMRNVADRLNVGTMSLYTHIPRKTELINLMTDTVYGQLYESVEAPSQQPGGWRTALEFIATRNWNLYGQHPWLLHIIRPRPILGPNTTLKYEAELRPLDNLGLSDVEMDSVLTLILTHVEGTARTRANIESAQQDTGISDAEWWVATEPVLAKVMDGTRFPVAGRVGEASSEAYQGLADPAHLFTFGLERILDGVALLIAQRQK